MDVSVRKGRRRRGAIWQKKGWPEKKALRCISVGVLVCMYVRVYFEKVIEQKEHRIILLLALYQVHLKSSTHGLDTIAMLVPWYQRGLVDMAEVISPWMEVASGHIGHIGQVSPQGFALEQLAPVTCSISRAPGDHIASNTPDTLHYYHNGNGGSCAGDDGMKQLLFYGQCKIFDQMQETTI